MYFCVWYHWHKASYSAQKCLFSALGEMLVYELLCQPNLPNHLASPFPTIIIPALCALYFIFYVQTIIPLITFFPFFCLKGKCDVWVQSQNSLNYWNIFGLKDILWPTHFSCAKLIKLRKLMNFTHNLFIQPCTGSS